MRARIEGIAKWFERRPSYLWLLTLELILAAWLCVPYLLKNNLLAHDMIGHWAAAAYTDRFLFPSVSGYNPYYYCGAPQNLLYPPLLAYLAAALGRIIGLQAGLKSLVAVAVVATPAAAYWCAREHSLRRGPALIAALVTVAELALDTRELGGNFVSTFVIGNVANALGLPLFLAYAASLGRLRRQPGGIVLPTVLLAGNLLTHLVGGLVSVALLVSHGAIALRKRESRPLILHGIWALALSSFFVVPLVAYQRYGSLDNRSYNQYPDSSLLLVISAALLIAWYSSRSASRRTLAPLALLCGALLMFHSFVFNDYFPSGSGLHVHRFKLYDEIGLTILAAWLASGWLLYLPKRRRVAVGVSVALAAAAGVVTGLFAIDPRGVPEQPVPRLERLDSRVMVLSSPEHQVSDHALQHLVPMRTGNEVGKGLFIETAANSRSLVDLELLLAKDPTAVRTWGVELDSPERLQTIRPELLRLLAYFGFGYVLANEPLRPDAGLLPLRELGSGFTLYRASYAELAETWTRPIRGVTPLEFAKRRERWLFGDHETLIVELPGTRAALPAFDPDVLAKARVTGTRFNSKRQRIELSVESNAAVPVLIKFTYLPQFRALDSTGHTLPLFRVAPNFMMVIGQGRIVVNYERTPLEHWSSIISSIALLLLLAVTATRLLSRRRFDVKLRAHG